MAKHKSSSLNPEFDEINAALLADMADEGEIALVCDECEQEYEFDADFIGSQCSEKGCIGMLVLVDGEDKVITLPEAIKNGTNTVASTVTTGSPYSSTTTSYKSCSHKGDKVIFESQGKQLCASNNSSLDEWSGKWQLIIDLAGVVSVPNTAPFISTAAPARFKELSKYVGKERELPSEVLRLYWTDMGIPPVGLAFWQSLWEQLPAKTVIACMGGHGRTGTCLASFMITNGVDYYSAVETVRTEHCHKAIETIGQERYLHELYVQRMEAELVEAEKRPDVNAKLIIDLNEDINYALANKPSHSNTTARYAGWGDSVADTSEYARYYHSNGSKDKNTTVYYPASKKHNVSVGSKLADAISSGRDVRTVNGVVFVEECIHEGCIKVNCTINSHQDWKAWDYSSTKVERALGKQF